MKYSEIKKLLVSIDNIVENMNDAKDIASEMIHGEPDFVIGNYRLIHTTDIDNIQVQELKADPCKLGRFNSTLIADNCGLGHDTIMALQSAEMYEEIGKYLIMHNFVTVIQKEYSRLCGYGTHFSPSKCHCYAIGDYFLFDVSL